MAVSLKKPDKVDLSKSVLESEFPSKLPEYTPVHLIDEEETIKSLSEHLKTIGLDLDDLEDFINETELENRRFNINLRKIVLFVSGLAIFISFAAIMIDFLKSVDIDLEDSSVFDVFEQSLSGVLDWLFSSPGGLAIILFFMLGFLIRVVKNFSHFR